MVDLTLFMDAKVSVPIEDCKITRCVISCEGEIIHRVFR